jgi:hypothetical protein
VSHSSERDPLLFPGPRAALLGRLSQLTVEDLHALDAAVLALRDEKPYRKRVDKGFWLAWYEGPRLTRAEGEELQDLFGQVVVAIAGGLTGLDVERFGVRLGDGQQGGAIGDLMRLLRPSSSNRPLQSAAIGLIEDAVAPWDPRLAIVACWNVACAATLRKYLPVEVVEVLEGAWRRAIGEPPA